MAQTKLFIWRYNIPPHLVQDFQDKKYKILPRLAVYLEIQDSHKRKYGYDRNYLKIPSEYDPFPQDFSVFEIKKCMNVKFRFLLLHVAELLSKISEKLKRFVAARS